MIDPNSDLFPNNVCDIFTSFLSDIDSGLEMFKRPLRLTDPAQSVAVYGALWTPDGDSWETGRGQNGEPTISRYTVTIQALVRDSDQERALQVHSTLSAKIRTMLVRNSDLKVQLATLAATLEGSTERLTRWRTTQQELMQNQTKLGWACLSVTHIVIETSL